MALSARERLKAAIASLINSTDDAASARSVTAALNTRVYGTQATDSANAVINVAETTISKVLANGFLRRVTLATTANVTADTTNYAEVSIYKRTAGGTGTLIAQITTKPTANSGTGNITRYTYTNVTVNTNTQISNVTADDALTMTVLKYGAGGAALMASTAPFDVRLEVEEGD